MSFLAAGRKIHGSDRKPTKTHGRLFTRNENPESLETIWGSLGLLEVIRRLQVGIDGKSGRRTRRATGRLLSHKSFRSEVESAIESSVEESKMSV